MKPKTKPAFAIWITGLPASGKSTLCAALTRQLNTRGIDPAVLESDSLRRVLTPHPKYDDEERDTFYRQMVYVGQLLAEHGVPVIFDATANRRRYRDRARRQISRFLEVYVECPLSVCMSRDPKGVYRQGQERQSNTVPGLQATYDPPEQPDLVVRGDQEAPEAAAERVVAKLAEKDYLESHGYAV